MGKSALSSPNSLFEYDAQRRAKVGIICGVDEAGRGPLAGDVFAAGVILSDDAFTEGLNDSKKLTEKKRDLLYDWIKANAVEYHICRASVEEIEQLNILGATMLAMSRVVDSFSCQPKLVLVDGNKLPQLPVAGEAIVKGDGISASIAAASILAKVERDRYMQELDLMYPQYEFHKHKGYGTKLHYEKLAEHGISPVHRPSFLKKILNG